jgi:hypothetical protein
MLKALQKTMNQWSSLLLIFSVSLLNVSCEDDSGIGFTADFSYEFVDDNHIKFINNSDGEYYSLDWDFANGETATTTDKKKTFTIYYPQAGEYNVVLSVLDYTGHSEPVSKTVGISKTDLVLSFTANIDGSKPNSVNLANTSVGDYDSFKWIYRNKEVENEINAVAYFPYKGNYEIELQLKKDSNVFSEKQSINISADDPGYIAGFTLSWADEFDGTNVNTADWTFETGASGWGNNELQNYTNGDND